MNKHTQYVNENLIHFDDFMKMKSYQVYENFNLHSFFCFDTESCIDINELTTKVYTDGNIPRITENLKNELCEKYDLKERVYSWIISNISNNIAIYGEKLEDSLRVFQRIISANLVYDESTTTLKCFVHNLGWDFEFFKYVLFDEGYTYHTDKVEEGKLKMLRPDENSFSILEKDNNVYSAKINFEKRKIRYGKRKYKTKIDCVEFIDSMKIIPKKLEDIATDILVVDEMFYKMGAEYDYNEVRDYNHKLTTLEKEYLYNDGYILKEFIKQFYLPLDTTCLTASSIAFESMLREKYDNGNDKDNYKEFVENYPVIINPIIRDIIKTSYVGGFTQVNRKYVGKDILMFSKCYSIDINSSYPSQMKFKPLPYGEPLLHDGEKKIEKDEICIYSVCFDGFKPVHSDDEIGHIKCGAINSEVFGRSGNDYLATNFIDGVPNGYGNGKSEKYKYKINYWNFELEQLKTIIKFYTYEKKYDYITELWYNNELKEGYVIEKTVVFKYRIGDFSIFIDKCMTDKTSGKLEGNKCKTETAKLKANSVTGKLASRIERGFRDLEIDEETGLAEFISIGAEYTASRQYYCAFTSAITAWGRVQLRDTMYKIGYNNIVYFDTDSLYTLVDLETIKNCGLDLHSTRLGAWDVEKEYHRIKAIAPKKYMVRAKSFGEDEPIKNVCKCAGLTKEVRSKCTFEEFYLGQTFKDKKQKRKVRGGYRIVKGDYVLHNNVY